MDPAELGQTIDSALHNTAALVQTISSFTRHSPSELDHPVLIEVASRHRVKGWSLLEAIHQAAQDKQQRRAAFRYLIPAVAHIDMAPLEVCQLVMCVRRADSSRSSTLVAALGRAFERSGTLGVQSLSYAVENADKFAPEDAFFISGTLAGVDCAAALALFKSFAQRADESSDIAILSAAITIADRHGEQLHPHLATLCAVIDRAKSRPSTEKAAWDCACRIALLCEEAKRIIEEAAAGPVIAQQAIAFWLLNAIPERWPDEALLRITASLVAASISQPQVRQFADMTLDTVLDVPAARSDFAHLSDLLCVQDSEVSLERDFPSVFGQLATEPKLFSELLTRWLLGKQTSLAALREVIHACLLRPELLIPDARAFEQATVDDQRRAIRRLLAFALDGESLCSFMVSLAEYESLQSWSLPALNDVLNNYVIHEFPAAADRFLSAKVAEAGFDPTTSVGTIVTRARATLSNWQEVLKNLPPAKELQLLESERQTLHLMKLREQREIHREARERSVFAKVVTHVNVKQGRKWTLRAPNVVPTVTEMATHVHGIDLPSSERADPVLGAMRRMDYASSAQ